MGVSRQDKDGLRNYLRREVNRAKLEGPRKQSPLVILVGPTTLLFKDAQTNLISGNIIRIVVISLFASVVLGTLVSAGICHLVTLDFIGSRVTEEISPWACL